jgi:hypothetical protein
MEQTVLGGNQSKRLSSFDGRFVIIYAAESSGTEDLEKDLRSIVTYSSRTSRGTVPPVRITEASLYDHALHYPGATTVPAGATSASPR